MSAVEKSPSGDEIAKQAEVIRIGARAASLRRRQKFRKYALMLALPALVAAGGVYWWAVGGRYASTDNAYVQQRMVSLSTDVSGRIVEVDADENQTVHTGDVIFKLDPEPYRIALQQADAALAGTRLQVEQMRATYQGALADLQSAKQTVEFYQAEFDRQQALAKNGYATRARLDEAEHDLKDAQQDVLSAEQKAASALAMLAGDASIETDRHPQVMRALAERDRAALDLEHTVVRAPSDGVISQTDKLNVGQYVSAATTVATLVETGGVWIEANFKETDLTHMRVGQDVTVSVDAYPDHEFTGRVASIGAGTGAEFALLPAQNASGNWVKVVQRVPVRISIDDAGEAAIRTGMSAYVSVDTGYSRPLPAVVRNALDAAGFTAVAATRK